MGGFAAVVTVTVTQQAPDKFHSREDEAGLHRELMQADSIWSPEILKQHRR
jgi:hypothetical protein